MAARLQSKVEERLVQTLAFGATAENAARDCAISPRTVHRRLADPLFRRRMQQARADVLQRIAGAMAGATSEALRTLLELMKPSAPASARLGSARTIMEGALKLREFTDLEERLAALEQLQADASGD